MSLSYRAKPFFISSIVSILLTSLNVGETRAEDVKVVDILASKIWLYSPAGKKDKKVAAAAIKASVKFPFFVPEKSLIKENLMPLPGFEGGRFLIDKRDMMVEAFSCPKGMTFSPGRSLAKSGAGACQ